MQIRKKSVFPIYGTGGIFLIYALIFPMYRVWDLVIALGISILGYLLLDKFFPGTMVEVEISYKPTGNREADQVLSHGKEYIERLDYLKGVIKDEEVSRKINRLQDISRQIFAYIAKKPEQIRKINTFMEYYYPTALKFLEHYAEYEGKGVKGENIQNTLDKIHHSLAQFERAFAHQADNLYSDKALDIEADIGVLQSMMKQEGL